MPKLTQQYLRHHVLQAEEAFLTMASRKNKMSLAYRDAMNRFIRLWSVLKMTHHNDAFFKDVPPQSEV